MVKKGLVVLAALLLAMACGLALAEGTEAVQDEWTVMFYFCGSDLESNFSYATGNLDEIASVHYPDDFLSSNILAREAEALAQSGGVNILIETGGSQIWHAQSLGMNIVTSRLQRWRYNVYPRDSMDDEGERDAFQLMQTLPLKSMAASETLSDFIRWGVKTCPAKKYALVLWGHGDGARTGLFIDELFNNDILYLYELKQALSDGGAHLEALVIDACLMSSIETAWAVKDFANWMVASEEIVPGKGTAIGDWLQELLFYPECDGEWLGRCVCDTTALKYANEADLMASAILTWAVVDLSKTDALIESVRRLFEAMLNAIKDDPKIAKLYSSVVFNVPEYGDGSQNMRDFGSLLYSRDLVFNCDRAARNAAVHAFSEAVVYCVRGSGRREARGLTFCYPTNFDNEELDTYADNFPLPLYLAILDAASDWIAPDWVYDAVERLPEINDVDTFQTELRRVMSGRNMPAILFRGSVLNLNRVYYSLYRLDPATGETVRLGRTDCRMELTADGEQLWQAYDPLHWPSINDELICMDLIKTQSDMKLYSVPVMINGQNSMLRCGRTVIFPKDSEEARINDYEIYGIWAGYDEESTLMNRSVQPLSLLAGQEYQLLYPIDGAKRSGRPFYQSSAPLKIYRSLDVEEIPLPAGTYYLEYEIDDIFLQKKALDRIEFHYDGTRVTFPHGEDWADDDWVNLSNLKDK